MKRLTIRTKLVLWNACILMLALAASGIAVHTVVRTRLIGGLDSANRVEASNALSERRSKESQNTQAQAIISDAMRKLRALPGREAPSLPVARERDMRVFDASGNGEGEGNEPFDQSSFEIALRGRTDDRDIFWNGAPARLSSVPLKENGRVTQVAQVVRSMRTTNSTMGDLDRVLWQLSPFAMVISMLGAAFLSGRALSPVGKMAMQAERIEAGTLSQRIGVSNEDELGRLAQAFNAMLNRLERSFEMQKQFTADASHELRTPLTIIKANTSLALNQAGLSKEGIRNIDRAADSMSKLVDDLLVLSRADSGQLEADIESVDLRLLLDGFSNAHSMRCKDVGVDLQVSCPAELWVDANPDWLERILGNLLTNSLNYTDPGGSLRITAEAGARLTLVVEDTGAGIPEEQLSRVFDRFYRADTARMGEVGVGLGLSICRQLLEAMDGSIRLESRVGEGTRAILTLPISRTEHLAKPNPNVWRMTSLHD